VAFVVSEIHRLEGQAVTEATEHRNRDLGAALVRYAHYLRDMLARYRRAWISSSRNWRDPYCLCRYARDCRSQYMGTDMPN
jgi:hypothetical protein